VTFETYSSSNPNRPRKSVSKSRTLHFWFDSTVSRTLNVTTCSRSLPHCATNTYQRTIMILSNACIAISGDQYNKSRVDPHCTTLQNSATALQHIKLCSSAATHTHLAHTAPANHCNALQHVLVNTMCLQTGL